MKPYWKVTLWYALFGAAWIFFSDQAVGTIASDTKSLIFFQTIKGWGFVALSSLLIFHLVREAWSRHLAYEREKKEVSYRTLQGAHHILLNYLNQMQLVTLEAERCRDFDPDLLKLAQDISDHAEAALMKLDAVGQLTATDIRRDGQENAQGQSPR